MLLQSQHIYCLQLLWIVVNLWGKYILRWQGPYVFYRTYHLLYLSFNEKTGQSHGLSSWDNHNYSRSSPFFNAFFVRLHLESYIFESTVVSSMTTTCCHWLISFLRNQMTYPLSMLLFISLFLTSNMWRRSSTSCLPSTFRFHLLILLGRLIFKSVKAIWLSVVAWVHKFRVLI